ncbi:MAG: O-antigen ligase family protein, partial [Candidatus Omnitrophota bacterium]
MKSLEETYKYATGILLFITVSSLTSENKTRIIYTLIAAGVIISLMAVYQYFFGFQNLLNYLAKTTNPGTFTMDYILQRRVFFPFVTPNILAGYLAMIIPLTLSDNKRIWLTIPLTIGLLLTKSIGASLSIFLALPIYFYGQDKFKKIAFGDNLLSPVIGDFRSPSRFDPARAGSGGGLGKILYTFLCCKRREFVFLAGLLVIIGIAFATRASAKKEHLQPAFSAVTRLNYWLAGGQIIKSHPFIGVGLGNFNLKSSRYAHNSYLQIWAEMG